MSDTDPLPSARFEPSVHEPYYGRCPRCTYNLSGNVSGRCPECGHVLQGAFVLVYEERDLAAARSPESLGNDWSPSGPYAERSRVQNGRVQTLSPAPQCTAPELEAALRVFAETGPLATAGTVHWRVRRTDTGYELCSAGLAVPKGAPFASWQPEVLRHAVAELRGLEELDAASLAWARPDAAATSAGSSKWLMLALTLSWGLYVAYSGISDHDPMHDLPPLHLVLPFLAAGLYTLYLFRRDAKRRGDDLEIR